MTAGKVGRGIGKTLKWMLIVGALIVVLFIIIAIVALGSAADDSEQSSKEVTPAEYTAVKNGQTQAQVRAAIGAEPERTDETQVQDLTMECWYYGILAESGTYQFCFSNGKLSTKSRI